MNHTQFEKTIAYCGLVCGLCNAGAEAERIYQKLIVYPRAEILGDGDYDLKTEEAVLTLLRTGK